MTISSEMFYALSNSFCFFLFQFGTTSAGGSRRQIRDLFAKIVTKSHSLFTRFLLKHTDVFPRFANGAAGLPKSIFGQALCILCVRNLLSGRFVPTRPSKRTIGGGIGRVTMRGEEAPGRGIRGREASGSIRVVGIRATDGRVVCGTTRAEKTSSPLGRRRGR